ncbi:MAG: hypothetical protein ACXVBB_23640, partial [Isosphaeraceae bacterium]
VAGEPISVRGSYAGPAGPDWGWRIIVAIKDQRLQVAMHNMALPVLGAGISEFAGLLTGSGPFSPVFALIPGRTHNITPDGREDLAVEAEYSRATP